MQRGEIYWLPWDLHGLDDGEIVKEKKARPIVVVSRDNLNGGSSVLVVPFSTAKLELRQSQRQFVHFRAGEHGLTKDCVAVADQITYVDKKLIDWRKDKIGHIDALGMDRIVKAIRWALRCDDLVN